MQIISRVLNNADSVIPFLTGKPTPNLSGETGLLCAFFSIPGHLHKLHFWVYLRREGCHPQVGLFQVQGDLQFPECGLVITRIQILTGQRNSKWLFRVQEMIGSDEKQAQREHPLLLWTLGCCCLPQYLLWCLTLKKIELGRVCSVGFAMIMDSSASFKTYTFFF